MTIRRTAVTAPTPSVPVNGLAVGETVLDRIQGSVAATAASTSGTLVLTFFTATRTEPIGQISAATGATAAAATPTLVRFGIYTVAGNGDIALIAAIANDPTIFAAASTAYLRALTAPFTKTAGQRYAAGFLIVTAAAMPTIIGANAVNTATAGWNTAPRIGGQIGGQTDLPASVAAASLATSSRLPQFTLLPPP